MSMNSGLWAYRRFLVVDETGEFQTQRSLPRMAQIATELAGGNLVLRAKSAGTIPFRSAPPHRPCSAPSGSGAAKNLRAEDCGAEVSTWLSAFSRKTLPPRPDRRGLPPPRARTPGTARRRNHDRRPRAHLRSLHVCRWVSVSRHQRASLANLNDRLVGTGAEPVPMDRFRTNFVVSGVPAFGEDAWRARASAKSSFAPAARARACIVTTTDQTTGKRGHEPLRTLATYPPRCRRLHADQFRPEPDPRNQIRHRARRRQGGSVVAAVCDRRTSTI